MPSFLAVVLSVLLAAQVVLASPASAQVFSLHQTHFQGSYAADGEVHAFLGVPFAAPPVGNLRWRAPRRVELPQGEFDARFFAPGCAQGQHMVDWYKGVVASFGGDPESFEVPVFSEDCLYLNIWAPRGAQGAELPVMVYFHGGSNKGGWSYEPNYHGAQLAREDVVVVTAAYRLGALGFFSHPQLEQSNFGLLDQVAALQWVRDNIVLLGGDPGNVTVFGESAGANDITHLLVAPPARGLFHRVIHQSGGWAVNGRGNRAEHVARGLALQEALLGDKGSLEDLRQVAIGDLLQAVETVYQEHYFDPVIDGSSIVAPVADTLEKGDFPRVDLLIGSNADEWLMYLDDNQAPAQWVRENLGPDQQRALAPLLESAADPRRILDKLITAESFVCPSLVLAERVAQRGGRSWFYYFSRQREGEQAATMGAYHGAELPYVFNTHDDWLPTSDVDSDLTRQIMAYWVNFARSGDPNGEGLPAWPIFEPLVATTQVLDQQISNGSHDSLHLCQLIASRR